jgi:hypothetical protein
LVRFGSVPLDITPEADGAIGLAAAPAVSAGVPLRAEHAFCVVRDAPQAYWAQASIQRLDGTEASLTGGRDVRAALPNAEQ